MGTYFARGPIVIFPLGDRRSPIGAQRRGRPGRRNGGGSDRGDSPRPCGPSGLEAPIMRHPIDMIYERLCQHLTSRPGLGSRPPRS